MNTFNKIKYTLVETIAINKVENTPWALLEIKPATLFSESYLGTFYVLWSS